MIIGKKFWAIKYTDGTPVSYDPASRPGTSFGGTVVGDNTIEVDPATAADIAALLQNSASGVGISGQYIAPGTRALVVTSATTVALNKAGIAPCASAALTYWDLDYPSAAGGDGAIQAVFCVNSGSRFAFTDYKGELVDIPKDHLVAGAVYYFQILEVVRAASGNFIGYSAQ